MTTIEFDKKCKCGPEFVSIRIIDNCEQIKVGNIWIPTSTAGNQRLAFGILEDVGADAAEEYGIKIGDYVLFDRLSTFYHTAPICVCKYNNVVCKTNEDKTEYYPLRNMLFVQPPDEGPVTCDKGVYLLNDDKKMKIGTVTAMNLDEEFLKKLDVKVGDKVLMSRNGPDIVDLGTGNPTFIYKKDMLICKVED